MLRKILTWWVVRAIPLALISAALGSLVAIADPLGMESAAQRQSTAFLGRASAPFYGGDERRGQSSISVVYLSEKVLREMQAIKRRRTGEEGWTWPPSYEDHADILFDMANQGIGPKAIMIDFLFTGDLNDPAAFRSFLYAISQLTRAADWAGIEDCHRTPAAKIACILDFGGTPVMIGKPSPVLHSRRVDAFTPPMCAQLVSGQTPPETPVADVLHELDCAAVLVPVYFHDVGMGYPLYIDYVKDETPGADVLKKDIEALRRGYHSYDLSPAAAMYVVYFCRAYPSQCQIHDAAQPAFMEKAALRWMQSPIGVQWGSRPPEDLPFFTKLYLGKRLEELPKEQRCLDNERADLLTFGRILGTQLLDGFSDASKGLRQPCPYTLEAPYSGVTLVTEELQSAGDDRGSTSVQRFRTGLGGRYVYIGGSFVNSSDWVQSPVHGRIPGVQYHAMALDNLLEWGRDALREPKEMVRELKIDQIEVTEFVVAAILVLISILGRIAVNSLTYHVTIDPSGPRQAKLGLNHLVTMQAGVVFIQLVVVALAIWWMSAIARLAPGNWLGLASLAIGSTLAAFAGAGTLPADRQRLRKDWIGVMVSVPNQVRRYFSFSRDRYGVHFRQSVADTDGRAQRRAADIAAHMTALESVRETYLNRLEAALEADRAELAVLAKTSEPKSLKESER